MTKGQYRSLLEAKVVPQLLKLGGEYEKREDHLTYTQTKVYKPDVSFPNGILVELKGYFDADDRRKMLDVRRDNPKKDIRLVFQRSGTRLNKKSSTTYGAWATKHGFVWCEASDMTTMRKWAREENPNELERLI